SCDRRGNGYAEIGREKDFLKLVERLLVELSLGQDTGKVLRQRIRRAGKAFAELGEPAPLRLLRFRHDVTVASSALPSSPATTASTSAPAPVCASSLTGVKSVERPWPGLSISTWMRHPLAAARCDLRAATPLSRSSLARRAMVRPLTCGMRAAGVPSRAEKGNTCRKVSPHSSTSDNEFLNIVSVSVGKPAMRSAPNTMSGLTLRIASQKRTESARA